MQDPSDGMPADDGVNSEAGAPAQAGSQDSIPTDISSIVPYVVPMFAYIALGGVEGYAPKIDGQASPLWYPLAYTGKLLIVMALAWYFRATWRDFRPFPNLLQLALAVVCGLVVWGLWIGLDGHYPTFKFLGQRTAYDPNTLGPAARFGFIAVRLLGLVVVVPIIEELFWRSFLMRWLIDPDFVRVPVGRVTPVAAALVSVFFAMVHPEWLPALLTGILWAALLWKTRSLSACAVSHATANLALGVYVLATGDWKYW
jgi:uncharacterized protein